MRRLYDYLLLPRAITAFEANYLARTNRIAFAFFALHVPLLTLLAWGNGTKPWVALSLSMAALAGPAVAHRALANPRHVSTVYGVTAMFFGGLLVHFGQGTTQIEMHFYFFALLAMLAVFANPMVVVAATVTVALHHLVLWLVLPKSIFNYAAPVWVVGIHALFVVLESVAVCFIARTFFDNVIGLEKIVAARTEEVSQRSAEMRRVLDNVDQGFVVVAEDGTLSQQRSRAFDRWFGEGHTTLVSALASRSPDFAMKLGIAWTALLEGFLPEELLLDQLPKRMSAGDEYFDIDYLPIADANPRKFLVVVTNVTVRVTQERGDRERMEVLSIFERVLADRSSVEEFFREANAVVLEIASGTADMAVWKRAVHTLKGNSGIFGLTSVAEACHELETHIEEEGGKPTPSALAPLLERWNRLSTSLSGVVRVRSKTIELDLEEHAALEQEARTASPDLWRKVHALKLEPTKRRLQNVATHTSRIAARLEKDVVVSIEDHGLRLDASVWAPFWSAFIHAIRNAVDHGAETSDERALAGKAREANITLRTVMRADRFMVEIEDDGRGIDWERVRAKATRAGIPASSQEDLMNALFSDGLSTSETVSEVSGRGVGMGALRDATKALGGRVVVASEPGRGTLLQMSFPVTAMFTEVGGVVRTLPPRAA